MDPKTVSTLLIVIACILLLPVIIGGIAGIFGVIGGILGGIFGLIGGIFGALFGFIGAIFGAIFNLIGWLVGAPFNWDTHFHLFNEDFLALFAVVLIAVLIGRSKASRARRSP